MKRVCLKCGVEYEGESYSTLCKKCAAESKSSVVRLRTCIQCEKSFPGYPRSRFCPECSAARKKVLAKAARERQKNGTVRKIGSTDICTVCGKEYTVTGGLQKYCPECAPEAIAAVDRAQGREWASQNMDYAKRTHDRQTATAYIKCAVCGKEFQPNEGAPVTCSAECAKKYAAVRHAEWAGAHKDQLNEYQRNRLKKKKDNLTVEELTEYRAAVNERARKNYKKRKEKENHND
ncbi:MAG: hypothetical protein J6I42_01830 [Clostridia bacterium]|nr:hypothetical protein [Clostridia bacterium]